MLLPRLALDLLLSVMADSVNAIHTLLTDEFLSGKFAIGIVNFLEKIESKLAASFGRNLPMTDSDLMVARLVFAKGDAVARNDTSSQCTNGIECMFTFQVLADTATARVETCNANARIRRTELDGLNPTIKCFEIVFGQSTDTFREANAEIIKSDMIILQSPCFELTTEIRGMCMSSAKRARAGLALRGVLFVLLLDQSLIFCITCGANPFPAAASVTGIFGQSRERHEANGAVLGRRQRSEQVGTLELLLEIFDQRVEPLAGILRGQIFGLAGLALLALLTHGGASYRLWSYYAVLVGSA